MEKRGLIGIDRQICCRVPTEGYASGICSGTDRGK